MDTIKKRINAQLFKQKTVELQSEKVELGLIDDLDSNKKKFEKAAKAADKAALSALSDLADSTKALEDGVKVAEAVVKAGKELGLDAAIKAGNDALKQFNATLSNHRKAIDAAREVRRLVQ